MSAAKIMGICLLGLAALPGCRDSAGTGTGYGVHKAALIEGQDPFVSHVVPRVATPGSRITVRGYGFGAEPDTVKIGNHTLEVVEWEDRTIVAVAPGNGVTAPLEVQTGGKTLTTGLPLVVSPPATVTLPSITAVEGPDAEGNIAVGQALTLSGTGFGPDAGEVYFVPFDYRELIGATPAAQTSWSDTAIEVTVPADCSGKTSVRVSVGGRVLLTPTPVVCQ